MHSFLHSCLYSAAHIPVCCLMTMPFAVYFVGVLSDLSLHIREDKLFCLQCHIHDSIYIPLMSCFRADCLYLRLALCKIEILIQFYLKPVCFDNYDVHRIYLKCCHCVYFICMSHLNNHILNKL